MQAMADHADARPTRWQAQYLGNASRRHEHSTRSTHTPAHTHMPSTPGTVTFSRSAESVRRKRERDRDCQRRKRQRERQQTENLQEKIRQLESQLLTTSPSTEARSTSTSPVGTHTIVDPIRASLGTGDSGETLTVPLRVLESCLVTPQWARMPLHGLSLVPNPAHCVRGQGLEMFVHDMRADTSRQAQCPAKPKVIDILYGGSKNPLANLIVNECSKEALPAPEKLAVNYALYKYLRWFIWPCEETFAALPRHLHPTAMQLLVEHQWCIDLVVWPCIRENMIRHQSRIDMDSAIGLFLCSSRMRGSFNTNFISRHDDGELELDDDFYKRFTNHDNWGLLETFWTSYPCLVHGLDPSFKMTEQDLLAT